MVKRMKLSSSTHSLREIIEGIEDISLTQIFEEKVN
jgi:hypothetical protein